MAWDREFYDRLTGKYTYPEELKQGMELFGTLTFLESGLHGQDLALTNVTNGICTGIFMVEQHN